MEHQSPWWEQATSRSGDTYAGLEWLDETQTKPTEEPIGTSKSTS